MFEENTDEPPVDIKKAWDVEEYRGKWYFYDCLGQPSTPFDSEEWATIALEDFSLYYEGN